MKKLEEVYALTIEDALEMFKYRKTYWTNLGHETLISIHETNLDAGYRIEVWGRKLK